MSTDANGIDEKPPQQVSRPKPRCKLVGSDGNVFSIISTVRATLIDAGLEDAAKEFVLRAFKARSYDEVLTLCLDYADAY